MNILLLLENSTGVFLTFIGVLGLLMGSFLNVVIVRLPRRLHHEWRQQAYEYLHENVKPLPATYILPSTQKPFAIIHSRSACPECGHPISALENIPLISYLVLKGKCSACKKAISWRYPVIELFTALISVVTAYHFGFTGATGAALILTWVLIVLSVIDFEEQLLPDNLTLSCLWLGLLLNMSGLFTNLASAVAGVIIGYLFLWIIFWVFKLVTHKEGMGYGDFKLLAMLGAWLGWQALPSIILLASICGAIVGITLILLKKHARSAPLPFGPFLAMAGWIALLWGDKLSSFYLHFAQQL
jgi:leader peptidase (prepilin peptidase)/N-methyltransferase